MNPLPGRFLPVVTLTALLLIAQSSLTLDAAPQSRLPAPDPGVSLIDTPPYVNLLDNGDFSNGLTSWIPFATPDMDHIQARVTNGVLEFYKEPQHDGRANQAVIFQWTNRPLRAGAPVVAAFDLGNSSSVRKRVAVLIHEDEFSDLYACTFWLAPNAPMRRYTMRTHTNRDWHNPTIAFYAATSGSGGGFYEVDNVTMMYDPLSLSHGTSCEDPLTPTPRQEPDGPNLLVNSGFLNGLEPWAIFHKLTWQLTGHVFEFIWLQDAPPFGDDWHPIPEFEPAPVIIQRTGTPITAGEILTATLDLGNSSPARKRVSVLLHQYDFADLAACSFWLEPGTPLQTYTMRIATTMDWSDAAFSVYAATRGPDTWIQFDNAELRSTPSIPTVGIECFEPKLPAPVEAELQALPAGHGAGDRPRRAAPAGPRAPGSAGIQTVPQADQFILNSPHVSYLVPPHSRVLAIEVSEDGDIWETVLIAEPSEDWRVISIDLSGTTGRRIYVRVRGT
jgi:hypothetical protein